MSSLLTVKLRRDLRSTWPRMLMMVIAIAVSLTVLGGVLSAWAVVSRETAGSYQDTEPASATILLEEPVAAEELTSIAAGAATRPGIIEATPRTQLVADVAVNGEPSNIPLQAFAATPDDPMRMARFDIEGGTWPPAADEVYLGQDSLGLLDVAVGDTLALTLRDGEVIELTVAGTVYDPSLAPAVQEQAGHAYLSTAALGGVRLDQLKIQVAEPGQTEPTRDRATVVAAAGDVGRWLQSEHGLTVSEIQVPEPYAHPHQGQSNALLLALLAGGVAALLLSAVLVANMLNGLFTQQIPQIGIMKAIGAPAARIGRFYLAMTLLVSAVATVLALAPAIALGRIGSEFVLGFLGIEARSLAAPGWVYLAIAAAGLAVPTLMTLVPLVRASRITVRAAIDHHGQGSGPGAGTRLMARLGRLPLLDRGLLMALRNTIRRPARFALAIGLLASAGAVFVAGMSLSASTEAIDEESRAQRTWDVDVQLETFVETGEAVAAVEGLSGVSMIEGWQRTPAGVASPGQLPLTRTYPDQGHGRVSVVAVPPGTATFSPPRLLDGRWLEAGETGAVVLNQNTRDDTVPDAEPGDTVQLLVAGEPTEWTVVGIAQERQAGSNAYVTAEGLAAASGQPQLVNILRITTDSHDEATREAVADAVGVALAEAGIPVRSADSISRGDEVTAAHLGPIILIFLAIAVVMGIVGGIGLGSTMSANVLERTREHGVMHAIGAPPKAVRRTVVAEGVFLALASCLVAALPAVGLTALLGIGIGDLMMNAPLPFRISGVGIAAWLVLVVLGAVLATEAAAGRASRLTVREALAYL